MVLRLYSLKPQLGSAALQLRCHFTKHAVGHAIKERQDAASAWVFEGLQGFEVAVGIVGQKVGWGDVTQRLAQGQDRPDRRIVLGAGGQLVDRTV
ncbi:hypothetical protein ABZW47_31510 [Streptomyces sp. NPDC004549]|uniref:hypothetical protein n=1 Tax=Streptomyces sp. NPDC004549 TaxID=3154283 RepID=UPI0033B7273E